MSGWDIKSESVSEYWEMGYDTMNYVLFTNPVSATVIDSVKAVVSEPKPTELKWQLFLPYLKYYDAVFVNIH